MAIPADRLPESKKISLHFTINISLEALSLALQNYFFKYCNTTIMQTPWISIHSYLICQILTPYLSGELTDKDSSSKIVHHKISLASQNFEHTNPI